MAVISLIEVDTTQLRNDIQQLRAELRQTRGHIESLRSKMAAMNAMWDGPTNQVMRQRFQNDHEQMLALCTSIEGLIQILESIRQAYDTCEDQVRGVVDALRI